MVRTCCVIRCRHRSHDRSGQNKHDGVRFFSFPAWKQNHGGPRTSELTKRRRMAWVEAVGRPDITFDAISRCMFVCSLHFHSGRPAYEMNDTDIDWTPSLHLGYKENNHKCRRGRGLAKKAARVVRKVTSAPAQPDVDEDAATAQHESTTLPNKTIQVLDVDQASEPDCTTESWRRFSCKRVDGETKSMRAELDSLLQEDITFKELSATKHLATAKREIYIVDLLE